MTYCRRHGLSATVCWDCQDEAYRMIDETKRYPRYIWSLFFPQVGKEGGWDHSEFPIEFAGS